MRGRGPALAGVVLAFAAAVAAGQDAAPGAAVVFAWKVAGPYRLTERSDWARYDDGRYLGHVYREVRASIQPDLADPVRPEYRGDFLVLEETKRDLGATARAVDDAVPAAFRIDPAGNLSLLVDNGFPSLRGFPAFPAKAVAPGEKWVAQGARAVDPLNDGRVAVLPLIAEYEFRGPSVYQGEPVYSVFARYATRYNDRRGANFVQASGTHEVDILIRAADGLPILIRDRLDETFAWADGQTVRFKGFTLTFTENLVPFDRAAAAVVAQALGARPAPPASAAGAAPLGATPGAVPAATPAAAAPATAPPAAAAPATTASAAAAGAAAGLPPPAVLSAGPEAAIAPETAYELAESGISLTPTAAGLLLTVNDVRFAADSAEVLPTERGRLDLIAAALRAAPDRRFLVEGHTADTGQTLRELVLSKERAARIVDELVARGLGADRFLFRGLGAARPVAPNDTEANRAKNRRVEITILD
jgi:outer membrane protein OmpA-like peptidoglycan-associated protein